ncbi:MAG: cupin domain-containing protein [Chloroflexi bacterium]|nr:cupin domain-containing protein [Chloroflexota bacterium]
MPVIPAADAPRFSLPDAPQTSFTGLASPSRGARETCVWRVSLGARTPAAPHALDHEEIIVGLHGRAVARIAAEETAVGPGDTIIVPAGAAFSLANPHPEPFEAVAVLPVGARASLADGQWFAPPWTV